MSNISSTPELPDPHRDADIARAERRRATLERLTAIGMELAEEIRERNVHAPLHPEPRHDPCRGYAAVARAVRFTVAFEARIDAEIIAMRKGEAVSAPAAPSRAARGAIFTPPADVPPSPIRVKVRAAVWEAINREVHALTTAQATLDCLHERLIDSEDYDAALSLSFRDCVAAICADLGLDPDWSRWSDDVGFAPDASGGGRQWQRLWAYNPARAEARRRQARPALPVGESLGADPPPSG